MHRGQIAAGGELGWVAGDAELGFGMLHGGAQGDGSAARGVRKPGVAHVDQEVHAGAHGQVRIGVRRDREVRGVELVGGVVAGHADVVLLARLQDAGAEFVEAGIILGGFYLVDKFAGVEGDYVVFAELEDIDVERHVAIGNVEGEVDQARLCFLKGELEPLEAFDHGGVAVFAARGSVGAFVVAAIDGLSELEGLGGLPGAVGRRGDHSWGKSAFGRQRWSFEDLAAAMSLISGAGVVEERLTVTGPAARGRRVR